MLECVSQPSHYFSISSSTVLVLKRLARNKVRPMLDYIASPLDASRDIPGGFHNAFAGIGVYRRHYTTRSASSANKHLTTRILAIMVASSMIAISKNT